MLQWIVVAPETRIISLVQVSFTSDRLAGDITPGFSVWSFRVLLPSERGAQIFGAVLYALCLGYLLMLEMLDACGLLSPVLAKQWLPGSAPRAGRGGFSVASAAFE